MLYQKSPIPYPLLPYPPNFNFWLWRSPVLGHIKFASLMGLSFHWWPTRPTSATYAARDTSLGGYWIVHIVVPPIGLQTPLAPWELSLTPPLGALCSIQYLTVSIHFCVCQAPAYLTRDSYIRVLLAKSCWCMQWCQHLEADYGMDPQVWQSLDGPFFHLSSKHCNSFHGCFVPNSKKGQSVHTLVFILLKFHVLCILYLGYSKFLG